MRLVAHLGLSWLCNGIVLAVVAWVFTSVDGGSVGQLIEAAAIFGVLNTVLKPLLRLITLPLAIVTLGLAWFGVSMLMLRITDALVPGFDIHGFWALVWATVVAGIVNFALDVGFAFGWSPGTAPDGSRTVAAG